LKSHLKAFSADAKPASNQLGFPSNLKSLTCVNEPVGLGCSIIMANSQVSHEIGRICEWTTEDVEWDNLLE